MKKLLVIAFVALCAVTSQASYLYWQVESSVANQYGAVGGVLMGSATAGGTATQIGAANIGTVTSSFLNDSSYNSFYIELFNAENESVAVSKGMSYSDLAAMGAITTTLVTIPTAWTGGSYAAPEPTSGLLMLLGVAALGLKRRKA